MNTKTRRRLLSGVLTFSMLASLLPVGAAPVEAAGENAGGTKAASNQQFDSLMNMDSKEPVDFDPNSTENPYGYPKGQPFLLNAENELMLYHNKNSAHQINVYDQWQGGQGADFKLDLNAEGGKGDFKNRLTHASAKSYAFAEGVAFDPNGTGRKDHVAYVGYDNNSIVVWVVDPTTGQEIAQTRIPMTNGASNWIKKDWEKGNGHLYQYNASNFFAITAGDYDGTCKDEIVVYAPNDGHDYNLYQFRLDGKNLTQLATSRNQLHQKYDTEVFGNHMANSIYAQNKLSCDLETGDFDGDGIDDLAVLSYINNPYNDVSNGQSWSELDKAYYWPWLKIAYGGHSDSNQGVLNSHSQSPFTYVRQDKTETPATQKYNTMLVPGMSAGDTDGDGKDEIVVAGLKNVITCKEKINDTAENMEIDSGKMAIAVFNGEGNLGDIDQNTAQFSEVDSNAWTRHGFYAQSWKSWQQAGVECVAFNSPAAAEHVFINGTVYDLSSGQPTAVYTPQYFKEKDEGVGGSINPASFIASTTVGNFEVSEPKQGSKNKAGQEQYGYEQLAFVVGLSSTSGETYYYFTGLIGGANYDTDGGPVGSAGGTDNTQFYDTLHTSDRSVNYNYIINGESESLGGDNLNCSVVAVDTDRDGSMAKYVGKMYAYSDPQVVAVLQAAPYFDELGDDYLGDNYGETTYEFTHEYEYTKSEGNSVSYGIGVTTSAETAFGGIDATLGSANNWSKSFEKSLVHSTTDSFSAQGYDSVVLSRTPVFIYNYRFQDKETGAWTNDKLVTSITVPKKPSYVQMSTTDYNDFVTVYNDKLPDKITVDGKEEQTKKMKPLPEDLTWLGQRGNPWGYSDSLKKLSLGSYELGYNGGTTSSTNENGEASSKTVETEHGFNFDFAITVGFKLAGNGVQAGPAVSLEYMSTKSETKTKSDNRATSGTVADIDSQALMEQYDLPENVIKSYKFTWELGKAECDLGVAGDKSLIIGYNVGDITAPAPAVTDLEAEPLTDSSVKLDWTKPTKEKRFPVEGYHVYKKTKNGKFEKVTSKPITATNYTVENLTSNEEYTFAVTTNSEVGESVWSNRVSLTTPKKNVPLTLEYNSKMADVQATHIGNIQINSGDKIPEESLVAIEATALDGYTITEILKTEGNGESEEVTPVDGKFSFIMKEETKIQVKAEPISKYCSVSFTQPRTGGTFTASFKNGASVPSGAKVTESIVLKAQPKAGFALKQWTIDEKPILANGKNTMTFNPSKPKHTISAEFVSVEDPSILKTIIVNPVAAGGTLTVKDVNGNVLQPNQDNKIKVLLGTPITITATPNNSYYSISKWTGALAEQPKTNDTVQLEVLNPMTIGVEFIPKMKLDVTFLASDGGNLTAKQDGKTLEKTSATVNPGSSIDFTAKANGEYRVKGWTIQRKDGQKEEIVLDTLKTEASYQLENILSPATVQANFVEIKKYDIAFNPGKGTGSMDSKPATEMTPFELPKSSFKAPDNQKFAGWKIGDRILQPGDQYTFTGDTTVMAQWKPINSGGGGGIILPNMPEVHDVNVVASEHGSIQVMPENAVKDEKVTLTPVPDEGYKLDQLMVKDQDGNTIELTKNENGTYAFVMPDANVTIDAKFIKDENAKNNPFNDVHETDFFYEPVLWAVENGITSGLTKDTFGPEVSCTRAQMATFLWRAAGQPTPKSDKTSFTDLDKDAYYYDAVLWAVEKGITKGLTDTAFGPEAGCNRAQMASFLYREAGEPKVKGDNPFVDVSESDYYYDAVRWAVEKGITVGTDATHFSPNKDCSRGEMVTFLHRDLGNK